MPLPGATPEWWFAFTQILVVLMLAAGVTLAGLRPVRRLLARLIFCQWADADALTLMSVDVNDHLDALGVEVTVAIKVSEKAGKRRA